MEKIKRSTINENQSKNQSSINQCTVCPLPVRPVVHPVVVAVRPLSVRAVVRPLVVIRPLTVRSVVRLIITYTTSRSMRRMVGQMVLVDDQRSYKTMHKRIWKKLVRQCGPQHIYIYILMNDIIL